MAAGREGRKALPLDPWGIHWGLGERHESGTLWSPDEWQRFKEWACGNGAQFHVKYGIVEWRENGYLHRENGPAQVWPNGRVEWCLNGELHREDGPAVVGADGHEEWWLDNIRTFTEAA
jgi:hypothetical protein